MNGFNRGYASTPPVLKNIILINVVLFLAMKILETKGIDLTQYLGLFYPGSTYFRPYQFVTHMFMHAGWEHIFFNMFGLWMFGRILEQVWGSKRFLIFYMVTGLGAAAMQTFVNYLLISSTLQDYTAMMNTFGPQAFDAFVQHHFPEYRNAIYEQITSGWLSNEHSAVLAAQAKDAANQLITMMVNIPTVGASGAIFGVLLAFGMLFPNTEVMLIFPPIPMKAKYFVAGYGAIELFLGLSQPGSHIAHFAHLGGMLFGFFMIKYWNKTTKTFY